MKKVGAKFQNYSKEYVYFAPDEAEVGDVIDTPTGLATITSLGGRYNGSIKAVRRLFKEVDCEFMHNDTVVLNGEEFYLVKK